MHDAAMKVGGHNRSRMQAFYADQFVLPLPPGHTFPMSKYRLLRERLEAEPGLDLRQAEPASDGELALAHTPGYISAVADGTLSAAQQREIGFPWSEAMVARSRRSVGATIAAARAALLTGVAANLAGGTHHASAEKGGGYCVFNDAAVAARLMQAEHHRSHRQLLRVAIVDLDVHQGNGSAAIFADDPTVFTLSMHGAKNFPFRKERSDLDVDLPDGCGDAAYLDALDGRSTELWRRMSTRLPGLIFYVAGADPHEGDRLGPPEAHDRRPGRARPSRARCGARAPHPGRDCRWPGATAAWSTTRCRFTSARSGRRVASWQQWNNARP